jgi:rare lipoprotein A
MSAWRFTAAAAVLCSLAVTPSFSKETKSLTAAAQHKKQKVAHRNLRRHHAKRLDPHAPSRVGARNFSGIASYYWEDSLVATGAPFNPDGLTAAHRTLPFGTHLRVTDLVSRRSVVVTVNDRGPFVDGRVLDLSRGAARVLGMLERGLTKIKAVILRTAARQPDVTRAGG